MIEAGGDPEADRDPDQYDRAPVLPHYLERPAALWRRLNQIRGLDYPAMGYPRPRPIDFTALHQAAGDRFVAMDMARIEAVFLEQERLEIRSQERAAR